jgi:hypothetical protein
LERRIRAYPCGTISAALIDMKAIRSSQTVVTLAIIASMAVGVASQSVEHPPAASMSAGVFKEIARRQNPAVVSITARSRVHSWSQQEEEVFRFFGVKPPPAGERVQHAIASGFIISAAMGLKTCEPS